MAKTAKEKKLEQQLAEAKAKQAGEIAQAQIEVYEGQTYDAKNAYQEAKAKRSTTRRKLPEKIPDDPYYKEKALEAQYIKQRLRTPEHVEAVDEYSSEIKKQQKAKETIHVLDKAIPQLYASAVAESKSIETKVSKAKVAETKRQEELVTGFQTAIITEQKAEVKRVATEKARVAKEAKDLADERQARADKFYADGGKIGKTDSKKMHYMMLGGTIQRGDIIPVKYASAGRGGTGFDISERYVKEASQRLGITVAQTRQAMAVGARTQSGKAREQFIRSVQDPSGKKEAEYQASRAQAKKNVASAYGRIAVEKAQGETKALNELYKKTGGAMGKSINAPIDMSKSLVGTNVTAGKGGSPSMALANAKQQQYVSELRAGNISIAQALLHPETKNSYTNSTMNTAEYLTERGYDITKPETIPNSVFSPDYSEKYSEARKQSNTSGSMGNLESLIPQTPASLAFNVKVGEEMVGNTKNEYFTPEPELQLRLDANKRVKEFDSGLSSNTITAQQELSNKYGITTFDTKGRASTVYSPYQSAAKIESTDAIGGNQSWSINGETFTDKKSLTAYVKDRNIKNKSQAVLNTKENKQLNSLKNKSGSLNPMDHVKPVYTNSESYNSNPVLNNNKNKQYGSIYQGEKTVFNKEGENYNMLSKSYTGQIHSVPHPITGEKKEFRTEETKDKFLKKNTPTWSVFNPLTGKNQTFENKDTATKYVDNLNTEIKNHEGDIPKYITTEKISFDKSNKSYNSNPILNKKEFEAEKNNDVNPHPWNPKGDSVKVFSGTDNELWNRFNYASAVDSGEVQHHHATETLLDDVKYYSNVVNRPLITLGASITNLALPQDEQIPVREVASGHLIGGTITDVVEGQPLRGTGGRDAWKYFTADPLRTILETPAEGIMWIGGGWAINTGLKGASAGIRFGSQMGNRVVQSNAPMVVKVPTIAVMGAGSAIKTGVNTVSYLPIKTSRFIGGKIWEQLPESTQVGLKKIDTGLHTMKYTDTIYDKNRMSLGTKIHYKINPFSRHLYSTAKAEGQKGQKYDLSNIEAHVDDWEINHTPVNWTKDVSTEKFNAYGQKTTLNKWYYDPNLNMKSGGHNPDPSHGGLGRNVYTDTSNKYLYTSEKTPLATLHKTSTGSDKYVIDSRGMGRVPSPSASPSYYMIKPSGKTPFATKISAEEDTITKVLGKNPTGDLPIKPTSAVPSSMLKRDSIVTIVDKDRLFVENIYSSDYSIISLSKGKKVSDVTPSTVGTGIASRGFDHVTSGHLKENLAKANEKLLNHKTLNKMLSPNEMKLNLAKAEDKVNTVLSPNEMKLNLAKAEDKLNLAKTKVEGKVNTVLSPNEMKLNLAKAEDKVNTVLSPNEMKLKIEQTKLDVVDKSKGVVVDVLNNPISDIPFNLKTNVVKTGEQITSDMAQTKLMVGTGITNAGNKVSGSIATARLDLANKKLVIEDISKGSMVDLLNVSTPVRTGVATVSDNITYVGNQVVKIPTIIDGKISSSIATAKLDLANKKLIIDYTTKGVTEEVKRIPTHVRTGVTVAGDRINWMLSPNEMELNLAKTDRLLGYPVRRTVDEFGIIHERMDHRMTMAKASMMQTMSMRKENMLNHFTKEWEISYIRTSDKSIGQSGFIKSLGTEIVGNKVIPISTVVRSSQHPTSFTEREIATPIHSGYLNADLRYASKETPITLAGGEKTVSIGDKVYRYSYENKIADVHYFNKNNPLSVEAHSLSKTTGDIITVPFNERKILEKNFQHVADTGKYTTTSEKTALIQRMDEISDESTINFRMDKFGVSEEVALKSPLGITDMRGYFKKIIPLSERNRVSTAPTLDIRNFGLPKQESTKMVNIKSGVNYLDSGGKAPFKNHNISNESKMNVSRESTGGTPNQELIIINKMTDPIPRPPKPNIESGDYFTVKDLYKKTLKSNPYSPATRNIVYTSSVIAPLSNIKTGIATGTSDITGVQGKIDTTVGTITGVQGKIDTGLKQDSSQKLNTETISRLKTESGIKNKIGVKAGVKLDTGLKQQQAVMTAQVSLLKIPMKYQTNNKKPKVGGWVLLPVKKGKSVRRGKRGKKAGFIGNVRLDNIMGMYKRKEITYGARKVTKLERQDARLTAKTPNRISMPASSLLKTKKKKKKKTEMVFGNKSNDEFGGFGLSKPKKTKRKKTTKTKRIL